MITLNKKLIESQWVDYDDEVKFLIRPFPISARAIDPSGNINMLDMLVKQANYIIQDWSGIKDVDGNDVKYTDENKAFLLDFSEEIIQWACVQSKNINVKLIDINQKKI